MDKYAPHKTGLQSAWMPSLQTYLVAEVFKIFSLTLVVLSLIFLMTSTFQFLHRGIPLSQFAEKTPFVILYFLPFITPVAMLAGITLGIGRMSQDLEITALRAGGIPYFAIAFPLLVFALLVSLGMVFVLDVIAPFCYQKNREVQARYVREILSLTEGRDASIRLSGGFLYIGSYAQGQLSDVTYWQTGGDETIMEIRAASGRLATNPDETRAFLNMKDVVTTSFKGGGVYQMRAERLTVGFDLRRQTRVDEKGMNNEALKAEIAEFEVRKEALSEEIEARKKGDDPGERLMKEAYSIGARTAKVMGTFLSPSPGVVTAAASMRPQSALNGFEGLSDREVHQKLHGAGRHLLAARAEYYRRPPFGLCTLSFALLALPITLIGVYKNRLIPFFKAFLLSLLICYLPLMATGILAENGQLSPKGWTWTGNLASMSLAALLFLAPGETLSARIFFPLTAVFRVGRKK